MVKYLRSSSGGKMSSPRSAEGTKKLVILIRSYSGFELYAVDFDLDLDLGKEEDYSVIKPRIQNRIPHPDSDPDWEFGHGFHEWEGCVVNSTLYMFQEFTSKWNCSQYELDTYFPDQKQVRKFHLSSDFFLNSDESSMLNSSEFLEPNEIPAILQFESLAPMNWLKCSPVAVPTPDGKIFVFDREIEAKRAHTCFELYDPLCNTWTPVKPPSFPKGTADRSFFEVRAYAFLDKSTFWFCTYNDSFSQKLQCTLDLNPEKNEKKEKKMKMDDSLFSSLHSITIDGPAGSGPVTISPGMSYRHVSGAVSCFQLSPAPHRPIQMGMMSEPFITLLDHHHKEDYVYADTLVSHLHYEEEPYQDNTGYLLIDACHTRLDTETPDTTLFATLKYKVDRARCLKSLYVFLV